MAVEAVIFDFGGVVTASPFEAFKRFEMHRGRPVGFIRQVNAVNACDLSRGIDFTAEALA